MYSKYTLYYYQIIHFYLIISLNKFIGMANKRQSNFVIEEEKLLISLVQHHKHIIESKKTGNTSWTDKKLAWESIEKQFNSQSQRNVYRNAENLKEKYNNLKKKTKKKYSEDKINIMKTGGGSYVSPELNKIDKAIYDIIGP